MWEWIKSLWGWIQFDNKQIADLQKRVCALEDHVSKIEDILGHKLHGFTSLLKASGDKLAAAEENVPQKT